jgi:hypothetical protein
MCRKRHAGWLCTVVRCSEYLPKERPDKRFSATGNPNDHAERSCPHCRVDCGGVAHRCADRLCHLPLENMVRMLRHSNRGPDRGCHSPYRLVYVNSTGRLRHCKASQVSREKNDGFRKGSTHPTDCDRDPTVKLILRLLSIAVSGDRHPGGRIGRRAWRRDIRRDGRRRVRRGERERIRSRLFGAAVASGARHRAGAGPTRSGSRLATRKCLMGRRR